MNIGSLLDSLNKVKKILKKLQLFKYENKTRKRTLNRNKFSREFINISQTEDYEKIYQIAMENGDYDFILKDDSIFQFSCTTNIDDLEKGTIRYAYYENPRDYPTYEEFLKEYNLSYEECEDEFLLDYEQEIAEAKLKDGVTPIRYDYNYDLYKPVYHPISHIHFGHNNNTRVAVSKVLTPETFVVFVLKNVYLEKWNKTYKKGREFKDMCTNGKGRCEEISFEYFSEEERDLLHII